MRNRFKLFVIFIAVLVVASFVSRGFAKKPTVDPKEQCYQFNAENQGVDCPGDKFSTWVVEYKKPGSCDVDVRIKYGKQQPTCAEVRSESPVPIDDVKPLSAVAVYPNADMNNPVKAKKLKNNFTNNGGCNEIWLRFADETDCNARCFISGGRAYCR